MTLAAVAALVSGAGSFIQGAQASRAANFQASVQIQQAERERQEAAGREEDFRRDQSRLLARRRALLGRAGVEAGEGSPLLASEDFAKEAELQALRIRSGGETRATRLEQQSQLTRFQGRQAVASGFLRAGSRLIGGFGDLGFGSPSRGVTFISPRNLEGDF